MGGRREGSAAEGDPGASRSPAHHDDDEVHAPVAGESGKRYPAPRSSSTGASSGRKFWRHFGDGIWPVGSLQENSLVEWWTLLQPIRTASQIEVEFVVFTRDAFAYQRVAPEAQRLRRLGMSYRAIGAALGEDEKTVRKALARSRV